MNKEMIERLKQNRVPNYLLTDEEWRFMASLRGDLEYTTSSSVGWTKNLSEINKNECCVYRLRSDYQPPKPELKIVKCEINASYSRLGFEYKGNNYGLCKAVNLPNFSHFEYGTGEMSISERLFKDKIQFCGQTPNKPAEYPKYVVFVEQGE